VAQAPLAETGGRRTGTMGDLACYSFYPSKNLGCYGDGGAVLTNDSGLAETVRHLANYGQAAPMNTWLWATIRASIPCRRRCFWPSCRTLRNGRECAATGRRGIWKNCKDLDITLPVERRDAKAVYHLFVIQTERRDECIEYLRDNGIMAQVHYPNLIHRQPCYAGLGYGDGDFPVAAAWVEKSFRCPCIRN